ncbi:hypothetical protein ACWDY4_44040 [Streptomyces olivaceoviridis]
MEDGTGRDDRMPRPTMLTSSGWDRVRWRAWERMKTWAGHEQAPVLPRRCWVFHDWRHTFLRWIRDSLSAPFRGAEDVLGPEAAPALVDLPLRWIRSAGEAAVGALTGAWARRTHAADPDLERREAGPLPESEAGFRLYRDVVPASWTPWDRCWPSMPRLPPTAARRTRCERRLGEGGGCVALATRRPGCSPSTTLAGSGDPAD